MRRTASVFVAVATLSCAASPPRTPAGRTSSLFDEMPRARASGAPSAASTVTVPRARPRPAHAAPSESQAALPLKPLCKAVTDPTAYASSDPSDRKTADAAIAANRWRFKKCLVAALAIDREDGGTVCVHLRFADNGATLSSLESTTASKDLTACVVAAFREIVFLPPPAPSTTFTVPVVLKATSAK